MSGFGHELDEIKASYDRRKSIGSGRYDRLRPDVLMHVHERQRKLSLLLNRYSPVPLSELDVLEIGCGTGSNLLELIELGADPARLAGNDLLPDRLAEARRRLPSAVALREGDATALPYRSGSFHVVYQSTVFSSVLSTPMRQALASAMWSWVRPGGGVLWYDFTYDNPANRDVHGISAKEITVLFPKAKIQRYRVTLAPPLARFLVRIHPAICTATNQFPFLRTHLLCWIGKT